MKNKYSLIGFVITFVVGVSWLVYPSRIFPELNSFFAVSSFAISGLNLTLFLVSTFVLDKDAEYQKFLEQEKK